MNPDEIAPIAAKAVGDVYAEAYTAGVQEGKRLAQEEFYRFQRIAHIQEEAQKRIETAFKTSRLHAL